MNDIKKFKEKTINNYISNEILNENSIDVDKIKTDLSVLLSEKPGVHLEYKKENLILEDGKTTIKKEKLESISIYYTYEIVNEDGNTEYRHNSLTYLTD